MAVGDDVTGHPPSREPTPMCTGRTEPTSMSTRRTGSREAARSINSRHRTGTNELVALSSLRRFVVGGKIVERELIRVKIHSMIFDAIMWLEGHEYGGLTFTETTVL